MRPKATKGLEPNRAQKSVETSPRCGRTSTLLVGALVMLMALAGITSAVSGCGYSEEVGDGGTVSTTETPRTTTTEPPQDSTTTSSPTTLPQESTTSTTAAQDTMIINVYFSREEKICATSRSIPETQQVGAAAMQALLGGPTPEEEDWGMVTSIPEGTTFLGLTIDGGVATVDLSKEYASGGGSLSMLMRLAEVVFTLTQFPTVDGVNFKLDGKPIDVLGGEGLILDHPMSRADYEELSPAILVESPTFETAVASPLRLTGTANVFEAVFRANLVNWDGLIIADEIVTASSGTGTRGTFDVTIPFDVESAGRGAIIVFAESPNDGTPMDVIEIPLQLEK
jgi:spore germination protein GerM